MENPLGRKPALPKVVLEGLCMEFVKKATGHEETTGATIEFAFSHPTGANWQLHSVMPPMTGIAWDQALDAILELQGRFQMAQ
jgi:hypothetical protein